MPVYCTGVLLFSRNTAEKLGLLWTAAQVIHTHTPHSTAVHSHSTTLYVASVIRPQNVD